MITTERQAKSLLFCTSAPIDHKILAFITYGTSFSNDIIKSQIKADADYAAATAKPKTADYRSYHAADYDWLVDRAQKDPFEADDQWVLLIRGRTEKMLFTPKKKALYHQHLPQAKHVCQRAWGSFAGGYDLQGSRSRQECRSAEDTHGTYRTCR